MLKQGRKREAKGLAVLYFIIGLIILLIILAVIYFALAKLDYSDRLSPDAQIRDYVEATAEPVFVEEEQAQSSDLVPEYQMPEDEVDLTQELPTLEPTEEPVATPEPTAEPTPEPTPEPTALPADSIAKPMSKLPKLPETASDNGMIGITNCYVSQPDEGKLMKLTGYGYVNDAAFDGSRAKSWLIVTQVASGQKLGYPLNLSQGISGLPHMSAACQNAAACDFEVTLNVSDYQEGIYSLALVIGYLPENAKGEKDAKYAYYPFSGDISFTVLNGQIITPVTAVDYE